MSKQIVFGCVYHWWRGDDLPELTSLPEFASRVITDKNLLASLHNITEDEIQARFDDAAHCYVAFLDDVPVGYGWVGTKEGLIRQGGLVWTLGEGDRYLGDFVTLPNFRGRGVYPNLLQAILRSEPAAAERFWIGHHGPNVASQRGIQKAGFVLHQLIMLSNDGQVTVKPQGDMTRAFADPQLPAQEAFFQNIPEVVRRQLVQEHAHLFEKSD